MIDLAILLTTLDQDHLLRGNTLVKPGKEQVFLNEFVGPPAPVKKRGRPKGGNTSKMLGRPPKNKVPIWRP